MQPSRYEQTWNSAEVRPGKKAELEAICHRLISNRTRYEAIEQVIGVPWYFVACIHERESSGNFNTYLGNGDPLDRKTVHVPAGRGPFKTWEAGAIDALKLEKFDKVKTWDITAILSNWEAYNGLGYKARGVPSPYVWSFTTQYTAGKFIADRKYSATAVDAQAGCAALLKTLQTLIPDLIVQPPAKEPFMATATPAVPASSPVSAKPLVAAAVQTATVPMASLWTTFTGMFSGVGVSAAAAFLSTFAPSLTAQILAYAGVAAGLVSAAAHGYTLFSGVSATNNATLMLAENLLNQVETALGGKPITFDNDPTPQTSS